MEKKRLYRIENGKMLAGVCGGIAEYFNVDPTLIRLLWVLLSLFVGCGIIAYILCAIIIPRKPV
ncbi:MAG: PspC domain-containing protein [Clostridiales bacterium]|nr:PspC domain-containing protein [Clostridiales bacterium]